MILKEEFLGVPKSEQPECTLVLEDCEDEGNVKIALYKSFELGFYATYIRTITSINLDKFTFVDE